MFLAGTSLLTPQRNCGEHPVLWRELGRPTGGVMPRRPPAREGHSSWVYRDTVFIHSGFTDDPRVWALSMVVPEPRWVPIMPRGELFLEEFGTHVLRRMCAPVDSLRAVDLHAVQPLPMYSESTLNGSKCIKHPPEKDLCGQIPRGECTVYHAAHGVFIEPSLHCVVCRHPPRSQAAPSASRTATPRPTPAVGGWSPSAG